MGSRKRQKPNPKKETTPKPGLESSQTLGAGEENLRASDPSTSAEEVIIPDAGESAGNTNTSQSKKPWYGGTWPRISKIRPVTQVAKESIAAATSVATNLVASAPSTLPSRSISLKLSPSRYLPRNRGVPGRTAPLAATITKLNITSNTSQLPTADDGSNDQATTAADGASNGKGRQVTTTNGASREKSSLGTKTDQDVKSKNSHDSLGDMNDKPVSEGKPADASSGWLSWLSSPVHPVPGQLDPEHSIPVNDHGENALVHSTNETSFDSKVEGLSPIVRGNLESDIMAKGSESVSQARSWLGFWGSSSALPAEASKIEAKVKGVANASIQGSKPPFSLFRTQAGPPQAPTSTGWAFWSRENASSDTSGSNEDVGKLAVADLPSQSQPESAVVNEANGIPRKMGKIENSKLQEIADDKRTSRVSKGEVEKLRKIDGGSPESSSKPAQPARKQAKNVPPNLILPSFRHTYREIDHPSLFQQVGRFLQYNRIPDTKRVGIRHDPPRVKKAVAIGVHGFFPSPLIRTVIGQPTGTSIRFANSAASAIQSWTLSRGYSCEIEKVALEGEGKVAERIELLWKLLLNWIDNIRKADLVMIACHSQGVPVAMILVAKLVAFGCVNNCHIGVCAMAGVNQGPFIDYKSRFMGGSAGELFDFAHTGSRVSKDYHAALETAVRFGVRVVYIGSIDDQLVSLESATFGTISHPYIFRAVFVDGRIHAPDFLTHLVGFALKLRNLGISDHGLIRELSSPLAGSLYTGEGHSRIYEDQSVYRLAVEFTLETTSVGDVPLQVHQGSHPSLNNPYILPFSMRGLLEEEFVRTELNNETKELLTQFDHWKPSSKVLKDVKFRLEGIRSKL